MTATPSENPPVLGSPIPTRFYSDEAQIFDEAARNLGLSHSETLRRAVRFMGRQKRVVGNYLFLAELTCPANPRTSSG